ncbi:unnamed protein product [Porites evermanni]|uniref:Nuclease HARBI1 n=1 Tax=Porites evermanni TaxID=104178 RepID=A0ABN8SE76_9CNID|nr:unnamed protein product [Porites evermanni]
MAGRQLHLLQSNLSLNRLNQLPRKRRTFRRQLDPLTSYTDSELRCRYRFGRDAINYIVGLVADDIMPETNRNHAVSAEMQVLITLKLGTWRQVRFFKAERDEIKQGLFRVGGFPCAIGCIDGTHVRITAPHENEPDFVNRKGYHSINVQAI